MGRFRRVGSWYICEQSQLPRPYIEFLNKVANGRLNANFKVEDLQDLFTGRVGFLALCGHIDAEKRDCVMDISEQLFCGEYPRVRHEHVYMQDVKYQASKPRIYGWSYGGAGIIYQRVKPSTGHGFDYIDMYHFVKFKTSVGSTIARGALGLAGITLSTASLMLLPINLVENCARNSDKEYYERKNPVDSCIPMEFSCKLALNENMDDGTAYVTGPIKYYGAPGEYCVGDLLCMVLGVVEHHRKPAVRIGPANKMGWNIYPNAPASE